ncbi:hypothetical protein [Clostridium septicum]|uniref:hypothetical protein n=1 Tax=Clostridium septicum TaxID=1504 RepID=UPI000FF8D3A2|nr:hypothetical protein [Clostridium septicum]QAS60702.1 hypothetical protein EI377_08110 [Clostridium septicum]
MLGPLGSIVGGMSGVGDKTHSAPKYFIVINYKNKKEELKVLSFEVVGFSIWSKFIKELKIILLTMQIVKVTKNCIYKAPDGAFILLLRRWLK